MPLKFCLLTGANTKILATKTFMGHVRSQVSRPQEIFGCLVCTTSPDWRSTENPYLSRLKVYCAIKIKNTLSPLSSFSLLYQLQILAIQIHWNISPDSPSGALKYFSSTMLSLVLSGSWGSLFPWSCTIARVPNLPFGKAYIVGLVPLVLTRVALGHTRTNQPCICRSGAGSLSPRDHHVLLIRWCHECCSSVGVTSHPLI